MRTKIKSVAGSKVKKEIITRKQEIKDFIGIYDGYLDKFFCDKVMDMFNKAANMNNVLRREQYHDIGKQNVDDTSFGINHNNIHQFLPSDLDFININFRQALQHYLKETNMLEYQSVKDLKFTELKIQKTSPGQGYHVWHIERGYNAESLQRVLAFTIYLNEVEAGETEFLHQKVRVTPKIGRMAIWPAGFPYVHRGNPPLDKDKYIVTSWLLNNTI
jgi:hypothetical protein